MFLCGRGNAYVSMPLGGLELGTCFWTLYMLDQNLLQGVGAQWAGFGEGSEIPGQVSKEAHIYL